jgi:hypothetical protein
MSDEPAPGSRNGCAAGPVLMFWSGVARPTLCPSGCRLPIEMWYPVAEWPPAPVREAFGRLGVISRKMDFRWGAWGGVGGGGGVGRGCTMPAGI